MRCQQANFLIHLLIGGERKLRLHHGPISVFNVETELIDVVYVNPSRTISANINTENARMKKLKRARVEKQESSRFIHQRIQQRSSLPH
jgi:hypothetical protein